LRSNRQPTERSNIADYDELQRYRQQANQKTAEQVIQQISNEYRSNSELAWESAAAGKWDDAAHFSRECKRLENEAAPYVQAAQQAQPQFTEIEQEMLRDYPQIANDPKKWAVAVAASRNLQLRGYDRRSPEYAQAVLHACDVLNSDLTESNEIASPNEALRASQSKYGEVTADQYNSGVERLRKMKKMGLDPMGQT
jgi:hypothetical protein